MPIRPLCFALIAVGALLLVGCSRQPVRHGTPPPVAHGALALPNSTGIAICDDYLASYLACHRAAGIFPPDQLQNRYEAMRESLLRDSQDPQVRPQLANRCNMLASQLRDVLHGRSCNTAPAAVSGSP